MTFQLGSILGVLLVVAGGLGSLGASADFGLICWLCPGTTLFVWVIDRDFALNRWKKKKENLKNSLILRFICTSEDLRIQGPGRDPIQVTICVAGAGFVFACLALRCPSIMIEGFWSMRSIFVKLGDYSVSRGSQRGDSLSACSTHTRIFECGCLGVCVCMCVFHVDQCDFNHSRLGFSATTSGSGCNSRSYNWLITTASGQGI